MLPLPPLLFAFTLLFAAAAAGFRHIDIIDASLIYS